MNRGGPQAPAPRGMPMRRAPPSDSSFQLPKVVKVSHDPPQVRLNPPRDITIVDTFEASSESAQTPIDKAGIYKAAATQLGENDKRSILVKSIKIWAEPQLQQAVGGSITLTELSRGIKARDNGVLDERPACGISFPAHLCPFISKQSPSGGIATIESLNLGGTVHFACRVWED